MKDPAVLFYFQDFLVGTDFMSADEVGKYIRILCHQADKGSLTLSQLKRICEGTVPEAVMEKLKIDDEGKYYQERMRTEREKRINYSESRRKNRTVKDDNICRTYDKHMENVNINSIDCNNNLTVDNVTDDSLTSEDKLIDTAWRNWKKYKKAEFNFKYKSEVSEDAAKKELLNLCRGDPGMAIKIIEQSIANGWKGLFNLKNNGTNKKDSGATADEIASIVASKFGSDR